MSLLMQLGMVLFCYASTLINVILAAYTVNTLLHSQISPFRC